MSPRLKILSVPAVVLAFSLPLSAQSLSRTLPVEVEAIAGDLLTADRWDFSRSWLSSDRGKTVVANYGDSLLAETIGGRRYWYALRHDSLSYTGEEDRLTIIRTDSAAFVCPLPLRPGISGAPSSFTASGTGGGRRFAIAETGEVGLSAATGYGTLILAPGDTLRNVLAVRERRSFTAVFPGDSTSASASALVETYRWYDSDGIATLLPVAMQRSVHTPPYDGSTPASAMAYLPDRGEFRVKDNDSRRPEDDETLPDAGAIAAALAAAGVTCDGRTITVEVTMPQPGLTVTVDIIDASGRLYLHESALSSGSADTLTLDCSSLRSGEYIAAIGVETVAVSPEKRLVIIR